MAPVQKKFIEFHHLIKLEQFDENQTLRDERDAVLDALREGLKKVFESRQESTPSFTSFNQGSYAMNTGVKPLPGGDYDIDVGIILNIAKDEYSDPVKVKEWVRDALANYQKGAQIRRSCVTVIKPEYHVDLAVYADPQLSGGSLHLAKGKEHSKTDHRFWQLSDPQGFQNLIANKFQDADDARQFRRCIRYLKRWRDVNFTSDGNAAPIGIGITAAAYHWFQVSSTTDDLRGKKSYDDRDALEKFIQAMLNHFQGRYDEDTKHTYPCLVVELPVAPGNDVFSRMTGLQMESFKAKLQALLEALRTARSKLEVHDACIELRKHFGDDFPVPDKDKSSSPTILGISGSGYSG